MKVLVINSGSSSIKFQLLEMEAEQVLASGLVERIGEEHGTINCAMHPESVDRRTIEKEMRITDHKSGMEMVGELLCDEQNGVVRSRGEIGLVGHRVVHGGESFHQPTIIDTSVVEAIKENIPLPTWMASKWRWSFSRIFHRWRCSIPPFTRPFPSGRTSTPYRMNYTSVIGFGVMAFTVHRINSWPVNAPG